jgi:hypothetical protein
MILLYSTRVRHRVRAAIGAAGVLEMGAWT